MNGAESLVRTLIASGVEVCFANPGTSEMHFCAALDRVPGLHSVLCLFEGVATGAADGYGRIAGKPAATLLHCGPGLANGLAYLHNASRARTPIVNIVGDQATYHAPLDPPLATDTEAWAKPPSVWVRRVTRSETLGVDAADAVRAARTSPGGVATLILPSDVSWNDGGREAPALPIPARAKASETAVKEAARALRSGEPALILLTGAALMPDPLADAQRIAIATGSRMLAPTFNARIARGRGRHAIDIVPYAVDAAVKLLAGTKHLILVGAGEPVAFFAYPGKPGIVSPADTASHWLAHADEDLPEALARLAFELGCAKALPPDNTERCAPASGAATPEGAAETLASLMPDNAILVDEAITLRTPFFDRTKNAPPHDWLQVPGGAIGGGLPIATGAALAARGRRVIVLEGDGAAMYTVQALWTQARENLDVTTIILSNRKYAVLLHELTQTGATAGPTTHEIFEIARPNLDWPSLAGSMGVEAARAESLERFADLLRHSNGRRGPFLIELMLP
jgi:acetolactate synthase I/II/III large subunit